MKRRNLIHLLALAVPLCADSTWAKIPPEVWAMKEDPAKGINGAVVLEDHIILRNTLTEYVYRVRILSEKGRRAAHLPAFSKYAYNIEGHTIYPDGHEVSFNKDKDFAPSEITSKSGFVNVSLIMDRKDCDFGFDKLLEGLAAWKKDRSLMNSLREDGLAFKRVLRNQ